jgi:cysteinyl-tRNA synthetase
MTIKLFNSLSKIEENFVPLDEGKVGMYVCGPTVYDRPHIGNARSVVVYDMLFRLFRKCYGIDGVTYVRNITDVDDKINRRAKEMGVSIQELTSVVEQQFLEDMGHLNCINPNIEPRATEHIDDIIEMIVKLLEKKHAYVSEDHVFFNVSSFADYTKLTGRRLDEMFDGVRIEKNDKKRNSHDFVLWKPALESDDESSVFDSPWGRGRPGWHIECSAMSTKYLGDSFDVHGGGVDLVFPHHTNEIAQSCACNPKSTYARYWVHNGFLMVDGEKMSKSLGNFLTVHDLLEKGISGEVIRFVFLTTHYRKPLNWTNKLLDDSKKALDSFYRVIAEHDGAIVELDSKILESLKNDLNTAAAISEMHEIVKQYYKADDANKKKVIASRLYSVGCFLGLFYTGVDRWFRGDKSVDDDFIKQLIEARIFARESKNWKKADQIRDQLKDMRVILDDHADGSTTWHKGK